jgi:peptidyl-prolyl cis-trans isomerase SurA
VKKFIIISLYFLTGTVLSQTALMTINDEIINTNNFEHNYKKSLELLGTDKTIENYIDFNLLKQYSLKNNIENSIGFQTELAKGTKILKDSLFYPSDILQPILQDYYKKVNIEKKFQLLVFKNDFFTNKRKNYKNKFIKSVIDYIGNEPLRFEEAVSKYSLISNFKSPSYLNVFSLNKNLVDAIYKAPLNQVTLYVDNYNNTYLILVSNERKYLGEVSLDQIYIPDTSRSGKIEIDKIYNELKSGESFSDIKQKVYQNYNISKKNNILDNDEVYNYVLNQIKSEPNNLDYSQPIKLEDGYIICEYYFRESYETYSVARKKIYNRLLKSAEIEQLNDLLASRLKNNSFYKENINNLNDFISSLPNSYNQFLNLEFSNNETLINIGNTYVLTKTDMLTELKNHLNTENYYFRNSLIYDYIHKWEKENILEFYNSHFFELNNAKEKFENLKDELLIKYALNLIAFQAQNDISGQEKFLHDKAAKLTWKERIEGVFYYCMNSEIENKVLEWLKHNKSTEFIKNQFKDKREELIIIEGKMTRESLNLPSNEKLTKGVYVVDSKNRRLIINISAIINNDTMTLDDLQKHYLNEFIDYKTTQIIKLLKKDAAITIDTNQVRRLKDIYN